MNPPRPALLRPLIPLLAAAALTLTAGCGEIPSSIYTFKNNTDTPVTIIEDTSHAPVELGTVRPHTEGRVNSIEFQDGNGCTNRAMVAKDPSGKTVASWPKICEDTVYPIP